ncbi:MAG: hypothetical protein IT548_02100 [Alphaproteobacteria bacterium]|nr:hypothetical protein [Alphaproteobacteria bacterium]
MPLTSLQRDVLALIAKRRGPGSFIAGGVPLNRGGARYSDDIDIFHDREATVLTAADGDHDALVAAGYDVSWARHTSQMCTLDIRRDGELMHLDWVFDSDYRFYPAQPDPEFGFVLHTIDLATNKALAAAARREPRDTLDLLTVDRVHFPLSIVMAAAVAKDPGYSPQSLIAYIRRFARYQQNELQPFADGQPIDAGQVSRDLKAALERAEAFVEKLPSAYVGLLFLEDGRIVEPDLKRLDTYELRGCTRAGLWPTDPVAISALLRRR